MTDKSSHCLWQGELKKENDDEKQKKEKQEYEKNRPDRKFSSKWQTDLHSDLWLVFNEVKNVMICTSHYMH
jgi:hypothetical protein